MKTDLVLVLLLGLAVLIGWAWVKSENEKFDREMVRNKELHQQSMEQQFPGWKPAAER